MVKFYTTETLSLRKQLTPEGYLVCLDVPVTRTGEMQYYESEVIDNGNPQKIVQAFRRPQDLFTAETIASFIGKPVTIQHPKVFVDTANHKTLSVGSIIDCRQGLAEDADKLVCDIIITDPIAIDIIQNSDMREVSVGYDTDYIQQPDGSYLQTNIRANHLAIVEQGRAGSGCAIFDQQPAGITEMTEEKTLLQKMRDLLGVKAEDSQSNDANAIMDMCKQNSDAIKAMCDQMKAMQETIDALTAKKASDEDALAAEQARLAAEQAAQDAMPSQEVIADAEIVSPGVKLSKDIAVDALKNCAEDAKPVIEQITKGKGVDSMPAEMLLGAVAAVLKTTRKPVPTTDAQPKVDFHARERELAKQLWG